MASSSQRVDFYYAIGSRYSYLASTQIEKLERETGAHFEWQPIYGAGLYGLRGRSPFEGEPLSGQYEWTWRQADAEAWAAYYGVPYSEPQNIKYDPRGLARACHAAKRLGAVERYSHALFRALHVDNRAVIDDAACVEIAGSCAMDPKGFESLLSGPEVDDALAATLQEAHRRGAFGVPTFFAGARMFFGNDRLVLLRHFLLKHS